MGLPPALRNFEASSNMMLNVSERPFSSLPKRDQQGVAAAVFFHREWFREYGTVRSQLMLLAFCNSATASVRARGKKSLLTVGDAVRAYIVGEVHAMQAIRRFIGLVLSRNV